ncbi:MAG: RNA polymerase sigma factor [Victivallaceae bacterium]|nr:RNA polymerase sigma factor [Victivallaceae bacterium]
MREHEDAVITQAVLRGDVERYSELLDKYQTYIGTVVARRVPEKDAPAVTHDVFVQAYKSLSGYSGRVSFGSWATGIAVRTCCNYWRREKRYRRHLVEAATGDTREWLENTAGNGREEKAEYLIQQQDTQKLLQWLLNQLSPEERALIESIYFDDLPLREIAAAFEWSLVKTKVRALRARRKMRKILETTGDGL